MSCTMTPGRVDASHWTYMATVISSALTQMASAGRLVPSTIPSGLLRAAQDFFRVALEVAGGGGVPVNPVASAANYGIAARALRASTPETSWSRAELNRELRDLSDLVGTLDRESVLTPRQIGRIMALAQFFAAIAAAGEEKAYERYVGCSDTE